MDSEAIEASGLTERQVQVLELRERGLTQREVADRLGTTASNVSRVEGAAERNIRKARHTLQLARLVRTPATVSVEPGTTFDELVEALYDRADEAGLKLEYCVPELYSHLYTHLESVAEGNRIRSPAEVGLSTDGDVDVYLPE
jgi:hypothetical protein